MSSTAVFQIRKFSSLVGDNWEHFPARTDIQLVVSDKAMIRVFWKSTVLVRHTYTPLNTLSVR